MVPICYFFLTKNIKLSTKIKLTCVLTLKYYSIHNIYLFRLNKRVDYIYFI